MIKVPQLTPIARPVVEPPVEDVERAQRHYCNALAFKVAWLWPDKSIGAVSREEAAIFREKHARHSMPSICGCSLSRLSKRLRELQKLGANIVEPLEKKPWGLTQFTVQDVDGHRLTFHHDL